jgi:tRNA(Ile)-lysidine synthase
VPGPDPLQLTTLPDEAGDGPVVAGFSGGLDSTVLLELLARDDRIRARGLTAVHVHHGLHADADAWVDHCAAACARLDVPLTIERVAVDTASGEGPEAAARIARHAAFVRALPEGGVLALAHHLDDQAETFLLRALRGSGVDGLSAMRPWRRFGGGWLWRPLLPYPRARLQAWAATHALRWVEDPGNADPDADRNFLRLEVMPLLRTRWPHAGASFARSAALVAEATRLLGAADHAWLDAAVAGDTLQIDALAALPVERRHRVLRAWIAGLGLPPLPASGVARIEADLLPARADAAAAFAWHGAIVRAWGGRLHAGREYPPLGGDWSVAWDGNSPLELPGGGRLVLEGGDRAPGATRFDPPLRAHARRGGERIRLPARDHTHSLKHALQEARIPPWRRDRLPLLSDADGELLAAGDAVVSGRLADWLARRGLRLRLHDPAG